MVHDHDNQLHDGLPPMERPDNPVCYHQSCPVCGRNLRIRVTLLGQRVYCQHCGGGFIATDSCADTVTAHVADDRPQLAVVDELIERAAVMLGQDAPAQGVLGMDVMGRGVE